MLKPYDSFITSQAHHSAFINMLNQLDRFTVPTVSVSTLCMLTDLGHQGNHKNTSQLARSIICQFIFHLCYIFCLTHCSDITAMLYWTAPGSMALYYIPIIFTRFELCFSLSWVGIDRFYPHLSGLHWVDHNHPKAPVPVEQLWRKLINKVHDSLKNK